MLWNGFLLMRCGGAALPCCSIFVFVGQVVDVRLLRGKGETEVKRIKRLALCSVILGAGRKKKIIRFTAVVSVHSSLSWYAAEQDLNFLGGRIGTIEAKSAFMYKDIVSLRSCSNNRCFQSMDFH